jgi:ABC-type oligopeptide transport system substrate-binding subunit
LTCSLLSVDFSNIIIPKPKFSKIQVRQAISYAIDNASLAKAVGFGSYFLFKRVSLHGEMSGGWVCDHCVANEIKRVQKKISKTSSRGLRMKSGQKRKSLNL